MSVVNQTNTQRGPATTQGVPGSRTAVLFVRYLGTYIVTYNAAQSKPKQISTHRLDLATIIKLRTKERAKGGNHNSI